MVYIILVRGVMVMNYCNIIKEELNKYSENEMIFASKLYKEKLYKKKVTET